MTCFFLNNFKDAEFIDFIYPRHFEIRDTKEADSSVSSLDCLSFIDNRDRLRGFMKSGMTSFFSITNSVLLSNKIPTSPACGFRVSHLVHYARACFKYQDFVSRRKPLNSFKRSVHDIITLWIFTL